MRRFFRAFLFCFLLFATNQLPSHAAEGVGFAGLEFLGSSFISRPELQKALQLRSSAGLEAGEKALQRLSESLSRKGLKFNLDLVLEGGSYFITVDIIDGAATSTIVNRRLIEPRHIAVPNEKPFVLLAELKARMKKLDGEGRPVSASLRNGTISYSDAPCMRLSENIAEELSGEELYLFRILASDPNGERRASAAELLAFSPHLQGNCVALLPALDDSDIRVRTAAAKYIAARIDSLPDKFPFDLLLQGLSRQLARPSHKDRLGSMSALLSLAGRCPQSILEIKSLDEERLKEIDSASIVPSIRSLATALLSLCSRPPEAKKSVDERDSSDY